MKIVNGRSALALSIAITTSPAYAEVSGEISLVSNYLSYGLTQSADDPALQLTTTWSGESGLYLSAWASQVDYGYGDETDTEVALYAGYFYQLSDKVSFDIGAAQFLYEGGDVSSDYNYNEIYGTLSTHLVNVAIHYAWDYFGADTDFTVLQIYKTFSFDEIFDLTIGSDYSVTGDRSKYSILGESEFVHYFIKAEKNWIGLNWSLSIHDTNMPSSETDEARVVAGLGWSF